MSADPRDRLPLPPPPVEPLPDLAWARLERAVLAELDAPETRQVRMPMTRWPLVALTAAALAGAAAFAIVVATRDRGPSAPTAPVADRTYTPSRIVTGDAPTDVSYGDAHITVAAASAVVLDGSADDGVLAVIERGSVAFVVAPRRDRPPFLIQAGAVGVRVVGTELAVTRVGADDAEVAVTEGAVEVSCRGHVARVAAGERWSSIPPVTAAAGTTSLQSGKPDPGASTGTTPTRPHDRKPTAAATVSTAQSQFEAAAKLEATDPDGATMAYRELARGKGPWAGNALYAMGRLAFDRGQESRARIALTAYVHRFPRGANVADARALLLKLEGASP